MDIPVRMRTSFSKVVEIINHRVHGCGLRKTAELCGVSRETVTAWSLRVGGACARLHNARFRNLRVHLIQADEIHTTIGGKQRRLHEHSLSEYGDCWAFAAEEHHSRALVSYVVGHRDLATTLAFAADLGARVLGRPNITTDAFRSYRPAIQRVFGDDVDYMQIVKRYAGTTLPNGRKMWTLKSAKPRPVLGAPDEELSSTSYIERLFGTLRGRLSKYGRRSAQFGRLRRNLAADLSLFVAYYNFVCVHSSLKMTPAQALGLTDHEWDIAELIEVALSEPEPESLQHRPPPFSVDANASRPLHQKPASTVAQAEAAAAPAPRSQRAIGDRANHNRRHRDRALLISTSQARIDAWHRAAQTTGTSIVDWVKYHLDAASVSPVREATGETRAWVKRPRPLGILTLWFPTAPMPAWRAAAEASEMTFTSWVQHHLDAAAVQTASAPTEERLVVGP
jgi:hypothetical protein